jgi:hypothetical protein
VNVSNVANEIEAVGQDVGIAKLSWADAEPWSFILSWLRLLSISLLCFMFYVLRFTLKN